MAKNENMTETANAAAEAEEAKKAAEEKARLEAEKKAAEAEAKAKAEAENAKKTVPYTLPYDGNDSDVFVCLNGRTYLIQKGVTVEVPVGVKEILDRKNEYARQARETEYRLQSRKSAPTPGV